MPRKTGSNVFCRIPPFHKVFSRRFSVLALATMTMIRSLTASLLATSFFLSLPAVVSGALELPGFGDLKAAEVGEKPKKSVRRRRNLGKGGKGKGGKKGKNATLRKTNRLSIPFLNGKMKLVTGLEN